MDCVQPNTAHVSSLLFFTKKFEDIKVITETSCQKDKRYWGYIIVCTDPQDKTKHCWAIRTTWQEAETTIKNAVDIRQVGVDSEAAAHDFVDEMRKVKEKDYAIEYTIEMQATTGGFKAASKSPRKCRGTF